MIWTSEKNFFVAFMLMVLKSHQRFNRELPFLAVKGHDVIAQAQSGTGKTATFSISYCATFIGDS